MKKNVLALMVSLAMITTSNTIRSFNSHPPRLTIIIVVDQFSYNYIFNKLNQHFKFGLRYLLDEGVNYTNAYMPHGRPSTATGHAGLNTGTYAKIWIYPQCVVHFLKELK